ncbi:hypothetical protein RRG08_060162 [Elysia crispata]|uniref:Uncharacterized protein n=1 Tax=Elysia crispata TaxID=231223 RepID=A0AAE0ZZ60_9GAST|nr:hypothetical protein RRG08_060162 [Elysia crispata]
MDDFGQTPGVSSASFMPLRPLVGVSARKQYSVNGGLENRRFYVVSEVQQMSTQKLPMALLCWVVRTGGQHLSSEWNQFLR